MNLKRIGVIVLILIILGVGGYWIYHRYLGPQSESAAAEPTVDTKALVVDTGLDKVLAEGRIIPLRDVDLSFQSGGQVVQVLVEEWQQVTDGQPLIQLDAADLQVAVVQAEAGLAQAQVGLKAAQTHVQSALVAVQIAQTGVAAAEAQLALTASEPLTQEIASLQSNVRAAQATISQSAANRDLALSSPTQAQIQQAEAQVAAALAEERALREQYDQILRYKIGGPPEEQTRFSLHAAEESLAAAQQNLDEISAGPTAAERQVADAAIPVAVAQRDAVQAQLDLLLVGPRPEQIAIAQTGVEQAQAAVRQAEAKVGEAEVGVEQAQAAVDQAQATLDAAQAALSRMTLRAPFDGTIASLDVELGQVVQPGIPIIILANMSGWQVETTDLTELDVVSIAVGMPASVGIDAIPNETLPGHITDIAAVAGQNRGDVTYRVMIALDEHEELPLRWGMTAFITVELIN
ncbi:MAG: efflux RND transporter periplasmic adaptor subunit [Anaerolineales bacterium]|nr:efflux RND transporter periplasmic adaptor subunit [Anaerolineales bacterium]